MDFDDILKEWNLKWISFEEIRKEALDVHIIEGIYFFRFNKEIETISGEKTDIIYIGHSLDINKRFIRNYLGGQGGKTTQRIYQNLIGKHYLNKINVSWHGSSSSRKLEAELLRSFEDKYHQLPVWNRSG